MWELTQNVCQCQEFGRGPAPFSILFLTVCVCCTCLFFKSAFVCEGTLRSKVTAFVLHLLFSLCFQGFPAAIWTWIEQWRAAWLAPFFVFLSIATKVLIPVRDVSLFALKVRRERVHRVSADEFYFYQPFCMWKMSAQCGRRTQTEVRSNFPRSTRAMDLRDVWCLKKAVWLSSNRSPSCTPTEPFYPFRSNWCSPDWLIRTWVRSNFTSIKPFTQFKVLYIHASYHKIARWPLLNWPKVSPNIILLLLC